MLLFSEVSTLLAIVLVFVICDYSQAANWEGLGVSLSLNEANVVDVEV